MKLLILGGHGRIGRRIVSEAIARGHQVTVASRQTPEAAVIDGARLVVCDVTDWTSLLDVARGQDAVISAVGPRSHDITLTAVIPEAARSLVRALPLAGVHRLVVVGGAGTLEIAPGVQRIDTPGFPAEYRPSGLAQREALALYRESDLDWTYLSPPVHIDAGQRTAQYRVGGDSVVVDSEGRSAISMEDYAVALIDEIETPRHLRRRFTVAY